ncbi:MAG: SDR family NAD(P)-dependent oxidoreductase [Desulfobacteraceae bacterium]|nr:SDR family NAD(P)-dependent oxidoreductase [Desulfobacteraceae bacterium]
MNNTAIVTGASAGIGRAIAMQLAGRGFDVVAVARRQEKLAEVAAEARKQDVSGRIIPLALDVTTEGAAHKAVALANQNGPLRWLVNNAGMARFGEFGRTRISEQLQTVELNCKTPLAFTGAALPHLIANAPSNILNIASLAAFQPMPFFGLTYGASKAFILSFSEGLSEELKDKGVTVTAMCPGAVETEFDLLAAPQVRRARQWDEITPEQCAAIALRGAERGRVVVIKGVRHRANQLIVKHAPRWFVRREMARRRGGVVGFPKEMLPKAEESNELIKKAV